MIIPGLVFAVTAAAIVLVGTRLSHHGDRIAELTGLGRLWIGRGLDGWCNVFAGVLSAGWMGDPIWLRCNG